MRAFVIDAETANQLSFIGALPEDWTDSLTPPEGTDRIEIDGICYLVSRRANDSSRLLVVKAENRELLGELPQNYRLECFQRILRAALSEFRPGFSKIPLEWRIFHAGSLVSFQTNRIHTGISYRTYIDLSPEGTTHVYAFHISKTAGEPLTRAGYDANLFMDAALRYETARSRLQAQKASTSPDVGHITIDLNDRFADSNVPLGIPFSIWRDVKLTTSQRAFFDTPFNRSLRVRGPAGSGKTLVLTMRFLKEAYEAIDHDLSLRLCFLAHGEEAADLISAYLLQIDERGIILDPAAFPKLHIEISTLHGLANSYINRDTENVQPLSLDGTEGRELQFELIDSLIKEFVRGDWPRYREGCRPEFVAGIEGTGTPQFRAFCYDLSDEFANVLEALGVTSIDDIREKYLKVRPAERALAKNVSEKRALLELYRRFRIELSEMGVVSLDQFTADFLAYLNSFRWDTLRGEKGFDLVFVDELHLFNAQERRTLGFLLRDPEPPRKIAVAYDPRQSPRNSFFPENVTPRDTIWSETGLDPDTKLFELNDVFRYTPQILTFLRRLNEHFPANDLSEDWAIKFGTSFVENGPIPIVQEHESAEIMVEKVARKARQLAGRAKGGGRVAVLCLDHERFNQYSRAGWFSGFAIVGGRDELALIERYRKRPILSMPEYVAGLQFSAVLLLDANANLVTELGGGPNGIHRFITSVYLGGSRAKHTLEIHSDRSAGGYAEPIRDALERRIVNEQE